MAPFMAPALVALTPSILIRSSSSRRSSTPQVKAPCAPPPCSARLTVRAPPAGAVAVPRSVLPGVASMSAPHDRAKRPVRAYYPFNFPIKDELGQSPKRRGRGGALGLAGRKRGAPAPEPPGAPPGGPAGAGTGRGAGRRPSPPTPPPPPS